ncbi:MAG TPA: PRC-barrel domain-containing protein [Blastocatellia bacterium]|nr:PRC-barrel domain-containing protein [Blastocatellia bacterium]
MLQSVNELQGFALMATDGAVGEVREFYFDDERWTVRYLVVSTGSWLEGRDVLISPISVRQVDRGSNQVFVNLTMDQVRHSPDIDTHKPVSRQHESLFMSYYGYPYYWGGPGLWGSAAYPAAVALPPATAEHIAAESEARARDEEQSGDSHLHSTREVTGYYIQASDDDIGHVEDFIIEDDSWAIRYLVVDTRNWLPGRKVLLAPEWLERVSWTDSKVFVNLTRDEVRNSPEYDKANLLSRDYETRLHEHYGRPGYWNEVRRAGK